MLVASHRLGQWEVNIYLNQYDRLFWWIALLDGEKMLDSSSGGSGFDSEDEALLDAKQRIEYYCEMRLA